MRRLLTLAALVAATAAAPPAAAQEACGNFVAPLAQGGYADWIIQSKKDTTRMRMALVGKETRDGAEMQWLEMAIKPKKEKDGVVMKFLVPGYPYEMDGIAEIIMQPTGGQAMIVPAMMTGMMKKNIGKNSSWSAEETCGRLQHVGEESVSTPAGSFTAHHYRDPETGSDLWVTKDVPFGVVKSVSKDGTMLLAGHGTDAKSQIVGQPQNMMGR
jgi:hypothetical protein